MRFFLILILIAVVHTQSQTNIQQCFAFASKTFFCAQTNQQCQTQLNALLGCGTNCIIQKQSNAQDACLMSCTTGITDPQITQLAKDIQACVHPVLQESPNIAYNPINPSNNYTSLFEYCRTVTLSPCNPVDYNCKNSISNAQGCFDQCYQNTRKSSNLLNCSQTNCTSTDLSVQSYINTINVCASIITATTSSNVLASAFIVLSIIISLI
ncbi:hypothetical protein ABPG74_019601 [Tetrahymena malaccensis]